MMVIERGEKIDKFLGLDGRINHGARGAHSFICEGFSNLDCNIYIIINPAICGVYY